jgi:hypothetical protein
MYAAPSKLKIVTSANKMWMLKNFKDDQNVSRNFAPL